jgi:hypothetical protein
VTLALNFSSLQLCHLLEADLDLSFNRKAPTYQQRRALRRFELRCLKDVPIDLESEPVENEQHNAEQPGVEQELKIDYDIPLCLLAPFSAEPYQRSWYV